MSTWLFQIQSGLILALLYYGVTQHRIRLKHVKIMLTAIIWDVLLILQIELNRSAIVKASNAMENDLWLNIHVSIAVTTVLLYVGTGLTGRRVLRGENEMLPRHRLLGYITLVMRTLTFVTSFFAVKS